MEKIDAHPAKTLAIFFSVLLFIGFLAGKTFLESSVVILAVFGSLLGALLLVCSLIYFFGGE